MAKANDHNRIFKSWAGISESALIKELATKGEHIELCIIYGARKRKLTTEEYELIFHDIVDTYVNRFLTEHLICKAETVLRNVQRNFKCFFYEFACKCKDDELREIIEDHLKKKEPEFEDQLVHLRFYNEFLKQLKESDQMTISAKKHMKRLNLESLMNLDSATQQYLMIEMYFESRNALLLQYINKDVMWDFLVENRKVDQIILWCRKQQKPSLKENELEHKYANWSIEPEMYEYALHTLQNIKDEVLRNCFVAAGYIFFDERNQIETVLQRICLTDSYERNVTNIESLYLGRYLFNKGFIHLLLEDFVPSRQLMELAEEMTDDRGLIKFLVELKTNQLETQNGFERINFHTTKYIQNENNCDYEEYSLPIFFDFLSNQPTLSNLQYSIASGPLKTITYLKALQQHQQQHYDNTNCLPNINELLKNFKGIDFKRIKIYAKNCGRRGGVDKKQLLNNDNLHRLNFIDYIKQSRSAYAIYLLIVELLENYGQITRSHLVTICESVYDLSLRTTTTETDMLCHCVAFCEMLGFDTRILRCYLKLKKYLSNNNVYWSGGGRSLMSVILETERLLVQALQGGECLSETFPIEEYTAILAGKAVVLGSSSKEEESLVLKYYASNDCFWRLLVLFHYFEIPFDYMSNLIKHFTTRTMGEHMARSLSLPTLSFEETFISKGSQCSTKKQLKSKKHKKGNKRALNTSSETITSSVNSCTGDIYLTSGKGRKSNQICINFFSDMPDLFALILLNTNLGVKDEPIENIGSFLKQIQNYESKEKSSTVMNFLRAAIEKQLPIMAVLAASLDQVCNSNLEYCWIVWLSVASNQFNVLMRLWFSNKSHEFVWNLIEHLVSQGQIKVLLRSFDIFYPDNALIHLFRFLRLSMQNVFGDECVSELSLYCLAWSNEDIPIPLSPWITREKAIKNTTRLLILHLQYNFESSVNQLKFLNCICMSGLNDVTTQLDFNMLREFFDILQKSEPRAGLQFSLNFIELLHLEQDVNKEYERVLECVAESKEYNVAVPLATLMQKPISDIVYNKWVNELQNQLNQSFPDYFDDFTFPFDQYEQEVSAHSLSPETLVNFLLYAGEHLPERAHKSRYFVMLKALNVIKHHQLFPNESFDRDQIEYDMVVSYLLLHDKSDESYSLTLYHSEYYEEIMVPERCVLYKSLFELRELAGIEDINISNRIILNEKKSKTLENLLHRLLDEGDVVEALRLQELFDIRPSDLRYLVYCMALAETVYSLPDQERELLSEVEYSKLAKFTKRTLCAAPSGSGGVNYSDSCNSLDFEEIPSKEKQQNLSILQSIGSKLKHGVNLAKRIISCYRAAMYLDKEYIDILRTKDVQILLQSVAEEGCMHRLLVVSDILTSTQMRPNEIAELLAFDITTAVIRPRFYILSPDQQAKTPFRNADLWGYNIDRDFHLFLELTPDRSKLGNCLLEYCDALKSYRKYQNNEPFTTNYYFERLYEIIARYGLPTNGGNNSNLSSRDTVSSNVNAIQIRTPQVLSHKKQNIIYVELLIKAHQSFIHECSMEGIANVLNRAKDLNGVLARAKSWSIIVRMLTGIGRYREMYFCFDTLIENDQFESLLQHFDEEKASGLRQAILWYLREYCEPAKGKDLFELAAQKFKMHKVFAEMRERDADDILNNVYTYMHSADNSIFGSTKFLNLLHKSLEYSVKATENYLHDNKLLLAQKSAYKAELIAMQIDLINKAMESPVSPSGHKTCFCVIQLKSVEQIKNLIHNELSVSQSLILSRAYNFDINWAEPLLSQYVIQLKPNYLKDFLEQVDITDDLIENVVKGFQLYTKTSKQISKQMDEHITEIVDMVSSVELKYKLASMLTLKSTILSLINGNSVHFLRDMKFEIWTAGRKS